jgi:thiamine-phosphate diphosphorylase
MRSIQGRPSYDLSLYLVANRPSFADENIFFLRIQEAVKGGVTCVQLRDHKNEFATTLETSRRLKKMLNGVPLFINTLQSIEVTKAVHAEGIFLEDHLSLMQVRRLLGKKISIGVPVRTLDEVNEFTHNSEVDYLSVKVSPSKKTCPRNDILWGVDGLRQIRAITPHRIVAIGGLTLETVEAVYRELNLDDGVAMAGGLMDTENPCLTAHKIHAIRQKIQINNAKKEEPPTGLN